MFLWLGVGAILIGAAVVFLRPAADGTTGDAAPEETPAPVVMQLLPSELYAVRTGTLSDTVQITGTLVPARSLSIPAEVSGRIDSVKFRVGDQVPEGAELATIDVETLRNRLEQSRATAEATRAQLVLAEAQLQRTTDLVRRGVSSTSALETEAANLSQIEANYTALQRQVETAEDDLSKARITAPFAGVISARSVDPGTYVTLGTELLGLVDMTALDLEGGVPAVHATRLKPGQRVDLVVDGLADHRFEGVIDRIAPVAVSGTRVLPVFARIENTDGLLKGGMFASGTLVLEESTDGIGIPADALREDDEGSYVLKITGDQAIRQPVGVVRSWNRGRVVEISSGLEPGDTIVALKMERLQSGATVSLVGR
ncbi:efflux RND transporter periplasmic adaptor subunit [Pseudogemmobacter bohemicus]|uniref:efflux RND transporter periplasmic adaptor subunit n=1 Tax=Pseudogemmobacter bohemicus TaxID=2250708 RepID=UPI00130025BF|nr:efflux RND transporter periplasmic adaptor subunit [Pseudogemmobacter bohemicus]